MPKTPKMSDVVKTKKDKNHFMTLDKLVKETEQYLAQDVEDDDRHTWEEMMDDNYKPLGLIVPEEVYPVTAGMNDDFNLSKTDLLKLKAAGFVADLVGEVVFNPKHWQAEDPNAHDFGMNEDEHVYQGRDCTLHPISPQAEAWGKNMRIWS